MPNYLVLLQIDKTDYYPVMTMIVAVNSFSEAEKLALEKYPQFKIIQISIFN